MTTVKDMVADREYPITYLVERELICPVCDTRDLVYAPETARMERCPHCGCGADLFAFKPAPPILRGLVWLTLLSLCGWFWAMVYLWVTS